MPEIQFATEFVHEETAPAELPEDSTVADFAIYAHGVCLTRNRPPHVRIGPPRDTVFGPVSGLAEWFIENWAPVLWETQTPFKKSRILDGRGSSGPAIPGVKEAMENWNGYIDEDCDIAEMADWHQRHLLGHACSDLAIPSMVIVPEENSMVIAVDVLPSKVGATVDFEHPSRVRGRSGIFVVRKIEFQQAAKDFVDSALEQAESSGAHGKWAQWLRARWVTAQAEELDPGRRLFWMVGDVSKGRIELLQPREPAVAGGLQQLLLDCQRVSSRSQLQPLEGIVRDFGIPDGGGSTSSRLGWQSLATEQVSASQPEFAQGYHMARLLRSKLDLGDRPIGDPSRILGELDVVIEPPRESSLFRAAGCARSGRPAHIIPSTELQFGSSPSASRFAVFATLGRIIWRSRRNFGAICLAQSEHALLSESRRANAFAANFLLPREVFEGASIQGEELAAIADDYGISFPAAKWHAHNARTFVAESGDD
jgi:hypothetical protein